MALMQRDSPPPVAPILFGDSGGGATEDQAPYYAPTYFAPTYFYGGAGDSADSTTPASGQTPYYAPTYFAPTYFSGGAGDSADPTTSASGQTPYYAPTYFAPTYFSGGGGASTTPTSGQAPYYAPTYFAPTYFYGGPATPTTTSTPPKPIPGRDGACYAALIALIEATGLFDAVVFGDPTRRGGAGADSHPLAIVAPKGWEEADDVDPTLYVRRVSFTVRARHPS